MESLRINKTIIEALKPCEDRWRNYLRYHADFDGTILEFLHLDRITEEDKVWVSVRVLPREPVEIFAIDLALRMTMHPCGVEWNIHYKVDDFLASAYAKDSAGFTHIWAIQAAVSFAYGYSPGNAEKKAQVASLIWIIKNL